MLFSVMPYLLWLQRSLGAGQKDQCSVRWWLEGQCSFRHRKERLHPSIPSVPFGVALSWALVFSCSWPCVQACLHQWWCTHSRPLQGIAQQRHLLLPCHARAQTTGFAYAHRHWRRTSRQAFGALWGFMSLFPFPPKLQQPGWYTKACTARDACVSNTTPMGWKKGKPGVVVMLMLMGLMDLTNLVLFIWPERAETGSFWLDSATAAWHDLRATRSIANFGLKHFFAAFGLKGSRDNGRAAVRSFEIKVEQ